MCQTRFPKGYPLQVVVAAIMGGKQPPIDNRSGACTAANFGFVVVGVVGVVAVVVKYCCGCGCVC